ncbi:hypothetical protein [Neorhizobium galegae]|uniref:hypothetical protein n=1 Tax=Neorhizobium galegae TaxID=399 RepID=UPI0012D56790|nr:hypothetical protein [Neorhizobium galegae]KAB1122246.1 hypothetical protein F4V90_20415 [Neorhizobium galegae]MCQ1805809.1 hypothetical protein [Neorhizobium galegae]
MPNVQDDHFENLARLRNLFVDRRRKAVLKYLENPAGAMVEFAAIQEQVQVIDRAIADEKVVSAATISAVSHQDSVGGAVLQPPPPGNTGGHPNWPQFTPDESSHSFQPGPSSTLKGHPGYTDQQVNMAGNKDWPRSG